MKLTYKDKVEIYRLCKEESATLDRDRILKKLDALITEREKREVAEAISELRQAA